MKRLNEQLKEFAFSNDELFKLKKLMQTKQNFSLFFVYNESKKDYKFFIR